MQASFAVTHFLFPQFVHLSGTAFWQRTPLFVQHAALSQLLSGAGIADANALLEPNKSAQRSIKVAPLAQQNETTRRSLSIAVSFHEKVI